MAAATSALTTPALSQLVTNAIATTKPVGTILYWKKPAQVWFKCNIDTFFRPLSIELVFMLVLGVIKYHICLLKSNGLLLFAKWTFTKLLACCLFSNGCMKVDSKKVVDAFHIKMKDISEFGQIIGNGRSSFSF